MFDFTLEEIEDMLESNEGICTECGAIRSCVEPDAEGYKCEECGENAVMGIELALITIVIGVEDGD